MDGILSEHIMTTQGSAILSSSTAGGDGKAAPLACRYFLKK
jgi:hypothetical protein